MTQGERIRELRKSLGLTMEAFGDRLGVGKTAISNIENGSRNLTDQMARSICREFSVSEEWLRTGEGEMLVSFQDDLSQIVAERGLTAFDEAFLRSYIKLSDQERAAVRKFMEETVRMKQDALDRKVEAYREELEAEREAAEESSASQISAEGTA